MMFVHADAVEADLRGKDELVDIFLVKPRALFGIVVRIGQHHPIGPIGVGLGEIQMPIRHQMEREEFHVSTSLMKDRILSAVACGCSSWGK